MVVGRVSTQTNDVVGLRVQRVVAGDAILADGHHCAFRGAEGADLVHRQADGLAQVTRHTGGRGAVGDDQEVTFERERIGQHGVDVSEDTFSMTRQRFSTAVAIVVVERAIPDLQVGGVDRVAPRTFRVEDIGNLEAQE